MKSIVRRLLNFSLKIEYILIINPVMGKVIIISSLFFVTALNAISTVNNNVRVVGALKEKLAGDYSDLLLVERSKYSDSCSATAYLVEYKRAKRKLYLGIYCTNPVHQDPISLEYEISDFVSVPDKHFSKFFMTYCFNPSNFNEKEHKDCFQVPHQNTPSFDSKGDNVEYIKIRIPGLMDYIENYPKNKVPEANVWKQSAK